MNKNEISRKNIDIITVLGPTASGKTKFASHLANEVNGEIISADSRQVYKKMDLGTGKDYQDYFVDGKKIPYHLVDIKEPGYKYSVFEFQTDFFNAYQDIKNRNKTAILCGGSGMYLEAVLDSYNLIQVPLNEELRIELDKKSDEELVSCLKEFGELHNVSDISNRKRMIRAIEIERYSAENGNINSFPKLNSLNIGINIDRYSRRKKIRTRLIDRLNEGMVKEVKDLIDSGLSPEDLIYYGLEYKFLTKYVLGEMSYEAMVEKLNTAINQFAKRQMTWFRRMQKRGTKIFWLDANSAIEDKLSRVSALLESSDYL